MALRTKLTLAGFGLVGAGLGLASWLGAARWRDKTSQLVDKLKGAVAGERQNRVAFDDLKELPAPVARYFRWALKDDQPLIRSARVVQLGELRLRESDDAWRPFEAEQHFSAHLPGFVWDASIRMGPLMKVRVRDAYIAGRASMQGKVFSLVSIVEEHDKTELKAGALQRYLAEAVWCPTALLPGEGIKWSAIDESRALATLTDSGTTVSLEFHFNDNGEIKKVFTPGRYRAVNGNYELTPWAGHFHKYEEKDGFRIPVEADVEWQLPDGSFCWWKGRIVELEYDFAR